VAELLAAAGLDLLFADFEHSSLEVRDVEGIVRAADVSGVPVLVRLPASRLEAAGRLLETGAAGLQVSDVRDVATVAAARGAALYPPLGARGLAPGHRAAAYGAMTAAEHVAAVGAETVLVGQIESAAGVAALPELLAMVDGPDAWFLGPTDLSCDLGHPGDLEHPEVRAALEGAADQVLGAGRRLGIFVRSEEEAARWRSRGATLLALGTDLGLLAGRARSIVAAWRAG